MTFEEARRLVMPLGKHKGETLDRIAETDEGLLYLDWIIGQSWVRPRLQEALSAYLDFAPIRRDLDALAGR
jgi:hypothetical protein